MSNPTSTDTKLTARLTHTVQVRSLHLVTRPLLKISEAVLGNAQDIRGRRLHRAELTSTVLISGVHSCSRVYSSCMMFRT